MMIFKNIPYADDNGKDHDDFVMIIVMLEQGPVGINVIINDHDNA